MDPPTLANPSHRRDAGALLLARAHMLTSQAPDVTSRLVQVRCCDAERLVEVECDQGCTTFSRATCQQRLHSVSPTLAQNFSTVDVSADTFVVSIRLWSCGRHVVAGRSMNWNCFVFFESLSSFVFVFCFARFAVDCVHYITISRIILTSTTFGQNITDVSAF